MKIKKLWVIAESNANKTKVSSAVLSLVNEHLPAIERAFGDEGHSDTAGEIERLTQRVKDFLDRIVNIGDEETRLANYAEAAKHVIKVLEYAQEERKAKNMESFNALERAMGYMNILKGA